MPWVNVYDIGECALQVWKYNAGTTEYELMSPEDMAEDGVSISADGGVVTLTTPDNNGIPYAGAVAPQFDVDSAPARLTSLSVDTSATVLALLSPTMNPAEGIVALSSSPPDLTPDPAEFDEVSGWTLGGLDVVVHSIGDS